MGKAARGRGLEGRTDELLRGFEEIVGRFELDLRQVEDGEEVLTNELLGVKKWTGIAVVVPPPRNGKAVQPSDCSRMASTTSATEDADEGDEMQQTGPRSCRCMQKEGERQGRRISVEQYPMTSEYIHYERAHL